MQAIDTSAMVCMTDSWFITVVVSMSTVCLMLSALIVIWGCNSLIVPTKLPM